MPTTVTFLTAHGKFWIYKLAKSNSYDNAYTQQAEPRTGGVQRRPRLYYLPVLGQKAFYRSICPQLCLRTKACSRGGTGTPNCRRSRGAFRRDGCSFISQLAHNSLTDTSIPMDSEKPADGVPNTFVPGRNLFFLSIAAVYAREHGIKHLVTGVSQTDFSGYPDCRDSFIKSLNVTLNLAMDDSFVIHTPLMWIDKCQTWALADELGVLDLIRHRTLTCYNGIVGDGCGHCPACTLRREGLEAYLKLKEKQPESK